MKQKVSVPFMLLGILFNVCLIAANLLETKVIQVFGMAPRIVVASLSAFLVGSFLNAYVMSRMKVASGGRHFSARAIWSTVVGETADSLIFFPVAFGGIIAWQELLVMMCIQIVLKSLYEVMILPVTIRVVKAIKRIDGSDVYDEGISYKVWKITEI